VSEQLEEVGARLDDWAALARDSSEEAFIGAVEEQIRRDGGDEVALAYRQAAPPEQLYAGLKRYWKKRSS
jgi:hypothetical protein